MGADLRGLEGMLGESRVSRGSRAASVGSAAVVGSSIDSQQRGPTNGGREERAGRSSAQRNGVAVSEG